MLRKFGRKVFLEENAPSFGSSTRSNKSSFTILALHSIPTKSITQVHYSGKPPVACSCVSDVIRAYFESTARPILGVHRDKCRDPDTLLSRYKNIYADLDSHGLPRSAVC